MSSARDISAIMRKVRASDTTPEVKFRKALWARGLRYKPNSAKLPGKPDIVLAAHKTIIFIDGDFWHGGQWRRRKLSALEDQFQQTTTKDYWLKKIRRNMRRDCAVTAELLSQGWTVIRFWESDIRKDLEGCVETTLRVLNGKLKPDVMSVAPRKTFAEFFAGIGLVRMGLERQGWSVAFANDVDERKREMYDAHFGDADEHFKLGDIHKLSAKDVPTVTLATASFPCNDLSLAGSRDGLSGKQSSAFWGLIRILNEMKKRRPPVVLIENVTGFLTSHGGDDFKEALLALNKLGYGVDAFILDAARFTPQSRQRLFVVGVLQIGVGADAHVRPGSGSHAATRDTTTGADMRVCPYASALRPAALAQFILSHPEINWTIRNLPAPPEAEIKLEKILEYLPDDAPEWWSAERAEYLLDQMSPRHRATAEEMIAGSEWRYGAVFRRVRQGKSMAELRTDGVAGCLRTPRGGSGRQILFKAGKGKYFARLFTPRECARLMGADDYKISAPPNQALFGFGDAVCVPVIEWIAEYYLDPVINELIRGRALSALISHE
ncbi:MAG TPA: DNA mismatch endonuclease Vsr [Blastocatellia bacterium]|nr:DNA mismatch endonuclease Vsr [Blastocatellia bacterium]